MATGSAPARCGDGKSRFASSLIHTLIGANSRGLIKAALCVLRRDGVRY
jgi:hypothetical protein